RFCYFVCRWLCCYDCDLFCILLCPPGCLAVFKNIGVYDYLTQIDSAPGGNGLTIGDLRAFFLSLRLNGIICKQINGQPAEYQFQVKALPGGTWLPVLPSQIDATKIGVWERFSPLDLVKLTALMERTRGRPDIKVGLIDGPVVMNQPDLASDKIQEIP